MGASRENQNIWRDIKNKNWIRVRHNLKVLISFSIFGININPFRVNRWSRKDIIFDSFTQPFNKKIGCKLFDHRWSTKEEEIKYDFDSGRHFCWKCAKWINDDDMRDEKLNKILK